MSKRTVTETDIWPGDYQMYPDLSVTVEMPEPTPEIVTITLSGEYAKRLYNKLATTLDAGANDISIFWRVLGKALGL